MDYEQPQGLSSVVMSVAWNTDGRRIISGSDDNTLRLWDPTTGKTIGISLKGHMGSVHSAYAHALAVNRQMSSRHRQ
jgi:WD40 repeat protein